TQCLEDADEVRDARQPVRLEDAVRAPLHLVERSVADAAEQRTRILVAHLPPRHDVEKGLQRGRRQPLALGADAEIRWRVELVAGGRLSKRLRHGNPYQEYISYRYGQQISGRQPRQP